MADNLDDNMADIEEILQRVNKKVQDAIERREHKRPRKCAHSNCGAPALPFSDWCAAHGKPV